MKDNKQSTNDQRIGELRSLRDVIMAAMLFLTTVVAIVILARVTDQSTKDLEARCKSLGGVAGQTKCFKDGKEI